MNLPKKKTALNDVPEFADFRQMLTLALEQAPERIAVKYRKRGAVHDVTYNELVNRVNALGTAMTKLPHALERVAILGENSYPFVCAFLTTLCSEGTVIPLDAELPEHEIVNILVHSECTTLFFDKKFLDFLSNNRAKLPEGVRLVCFDAGKTALPDGIGSYEDLVYAGEELLALKDECFTILSPSDERTALLVYKTDSSEGLRGVMLSQFALRSAVCGILQLNAPGSRCLSILPFYRSCELVEGLLCSFHSHATVCIGEGTRSFQNDLQYFKPDYLLLPPLYVENIWKKVTASIEKQGRAETLQTLIRTSNAMRKVGIDRRKTFFAAVHELLGGNLRVIHVGDGAIDPEAVRFFDDVGVTVLGSYGVPECASMVSTNTEKNNDFSSSGALLPCVEVKISGADEEGVGEICVRGDVLMTGYYKNESATKKVTELSGWFHTGDLGRLNAQGQLFLTGHIGSDIRLKCGRVVSPDEIRDYLLTLPGVRDASVYAGKDSGGAEFTIEADVVLNDPVPGQSRAERTQAFKEKVDALNRTLPPYKRIDSVHIRRELAVSSGGDPAGNEKKQ